MAMEGCLPRPNVDTNRTENMITLVGLRLTNGPDTARAGFRMAETFAESGVRVLLLNLTDKLPTFDVDPPVGDLGDAFITRFADMSSCIETTEVPMLEYAQVQRPLKQLNDEISEFLGSTPDWEGFFSGNVVQLSLAYDVCVVVADLSHDLVVRQLQMVADFALPLRGSGHAEDYAKEMMRMVPKGKIPGIMYLPGTLEDRKNDSDMVVGLNHVDVEDMDANGTIKVLSMALAQRPCL